MKKIMIIIACVGCCFQARSQWVVTDWINFAQNLINSANQVYEGARTAEGMLDNFEETRRIYQQGKEHLDGLKYVTPQVKNYRRVVQCVNIVGDIADSYVANYNKMLRDDNFNALELNAIGTAYNQILKESSSTLAELEQVINTGTYVMSDNERLERIDSVYERLEEYRRINDAFTRRNIGISVERSMKKKEARSVIEFYGGGKERYW